MKTLEMQKACADQFWFSQAVRKKDKNLCEKINNDADKNVCSNSLK
jgi:hypothetical protein